MKNEFRDKSEKELNAVLREKQEGLRTFRFSMSGSKVKNVKEGNVLRKDTARILTELGRTKK
jgi:ribosomal protein L29